MSQITTEQTQQLVDDWIADLRSGQQKQGFGKLRNSSDEYCCLARLIEIVITRNWIPITVHAPDVGRDRYLYEYEQSCQGGYIPSSIAQYIGISSEEGQYVSDDGLNQLLSIDNDDRKLSFPEIAQIIEDHQTELFPILAE